MRIVCETRAESWCVLAEWLGSERKVHEGTLWECIQYRAENSDK